MWFDNEQFLKIDDEYHQHGLTAARFPPCSGDLNPIENVWSKLRKDLAKREFEDLKMTLSSPPSSSNTGSLSC